MQERRLADRRKKHVLFSDWRYAFKGRRRASRRPGDTQVAGVDRYEGSVFWLALAIIVLSCCDATFTLILMREGIVQEWNPFMRVLMEQDVQLFANVKTVITGASVVFMVTCYHGIVLGGIPVRWIFKGIVAGYALLVTYEISLILTHL